MVILNAMRMPGNHKNTAGNNDTENFGKTVEEKKVVATDQEHP
jgi:hypothetical protein